MEGRTTRRFQPGRTVQRLCLDGTTENLESRTPRSRSLVNAQSVSRTVHIINRSGWLKFSASGTSFCLSPHQQQTSVFIS
jgi:hypothetical protein